MTVTGTLTVQAIDLTEFNTLLARVQNMATALNVNSDENGLTITFDVSITG